MALFADDAHDRVDQLIALTERLTERLAEETRYFEATFLSQMLQPMFAGLSTEAPFGGGAGEQTWRSFMVDAMARRVASGGGIGLADHVQRELIAMQGGAAPAASEPV